MSDPVTSIEELRVKLTDADAEDDALTLSRLIAMARGHVLKAEGKLPEQRAEARLSAQTQSAEPQDDWERSAFYTVAYSRGFASGRQHERRLSAHEWGEEDVERAVRTFHDELFEGILEQEDVQRWTDAFAKALSTLPRLSAQAQGGTGERMAYILKERLEDGETIDAELIEKIGWYVDQPTPPITDEDRRWATDWIRDNAQERFSPPSVGSETGDE